MLNAIDFANPGIEAFLSGHLPHLAALGPPICLGRRFLGAGLRHGRRAARRRTEVAALELNLSCPNVDEVRRTWGRWSRRFGP
jgi:dihydroorotate dehydrogenase (NAD+) catalytic subunit